jgi:pilus assembly protein Flp/PilA
VKPSLRVSSRAEDGASAVEYGLLVAGIAGLVAAIVFVFGNAVLGLFDSTCASINSGSNGEMAQVNC